MPHISGFAAAQYRELVQAVDASTAFSVGQNKQGTRAFDELANTDTIMYRAVSQDDPTKWEVGLGTYASSGKTLTRTTILASSNSNNAVNFKASSGAGANILIEGLWGVPSTAANYTITAFSARRNHAANEGTAGNISAALATLINDLIAAGIIRGSVS